MRKAMLFTILIYISCGVPKNFVGKCRVCSSNFDKETICGTFMPYQTAYSVSDRKKGSWVECY